MPEWLRAWLRFRLIPALGLQPEQLALGVLRGVYDTLLLVLLGLGFLTGGRFYMNDQYALPRSMQATVLKWAAISDRIAREADIPRETPLVLWFKENSMQAENPELCTGIIGAYDLVRSGEHACFTPGPISDFEVAEQLAIAAVEFKKRCPEVTYFTQSPDTLKRCYFAYNAGTGAASRLNADNSAYVMNGYDAAHTNMVYSDVELGTVQVTSLGAWPAHLAMQSLILSQQDKEKRPFAITLFDISTRAYDWVNHSIASLSDESFTNSTHMPFPEQRSLNDVDCLDEPHIWGRPSLRPKLNPVADAPILTQDTHGCSYSLPGIDISSAENRSSILQAPIPGELTTYTDRWYNSAIRIENKEWIVWLLHPRSYLVKEGTVKRGQAVGVMGAVGIATGPHVHYTIFDKVNETFVDSRHFLP
ncbi:MAG: M23 family metallopeptidase [Chloroflexi bacterium]|nr:M23 family metallopeptidase [Chloroflexota bacterium]